MSMRFSIVNLGCKVNRVESDAFGSALLGSGAKPAEGKPADIVIVNTCTVTAEAEKKTRKAVRHALKTEPFAEVWVTGCASSIDPELYASMDERVRVLSKDQVLDRIERAGVHEPSSKREDGRTRLGVKVQDGCDNACTYCIVRVARGPARSIPADEVARECLALCEAGVPEIILTGIDLGAYSYDGLALPELLEHLMDVLPLKGEDGRLLRRLRISSIEPQSVTRKLLEVISASDGAVCKHLHLPLQSGSSKVLKEMARRYDADDFLGTVDVARGLMPDISLTTDIIAGFPGERDMDHEKTIQACRRAGFSKMHVFPYSMRMGTLAATRTDQVPADVKQARSAQLRELSRALRQEDLSRRWGSEELVALMGDGTAMTESYHEIFVPVGLPSGELSKMMLQPSLLMP